MLLWIRKIDVAVSCCVTRVTSTETTPVNTNRHCYVTKQQSLFPFGCSATAATGNPKEAISRETPRINVWSIGWRHAVQLSGSIMQWATPQDGPNKTDKKEKQMSDSNTIYSKVIARLYVNDRFGKGIGNKRINRFIFNGALEFPDTGNKLWVDLPELEYAKTSFHITDYARLSDVIHVYIREILNADPYDKERFLTGQLFDLKPKTWANGFLLYDVDTSKSIVTIWDDHETNWNQTMPKAIISESFPITPVHKQCEGRAPDYFGTNFDLEETKSTTPTAPTTSGLGTSINPNAVIEKVRAQMDI